jgi:hypothetical protein
MDAYNGRGHRPLSISFTLQEWDAVITALMCSADSTSGLGDYPTVKPLQERLQAAYARAVGVPVASNSMLSDAIPNASNAPFFTESK